MNSPLHLSLLQTSLHWEDRTANLAHFEEKIHSMNTPTDIIVLPEMFSTGFTMNAAANAEPMDGPAMQWIRRIALEKKCVITGSLIIEINGQYFNRLIWMQPDGKELHYDKRHLFRLAGEEKTYTAGNRPLIVEYKGWKILPLICYDLRFPVWSRRSATNDYDMIMYVANWPERRNTAWKQLLPARAIENQAYVAAVNRIGNDGNGIPHTGDSVLLDFTGQPITAPASNSDCIITAELKEEPLVEFRNQFPFWQDADAFEMK